MGYLDHGGKRAFWVVHRRGGKDLTALHQTCKMAHKRVGTYWHIFPTGEQGKKAIWEGFTKDGKRIMEQVFPTSIRRRPREFAPSGEMVVELKCGSIWRLMGSDKLEVVGAGPVGVVFSEFALAKPKTWDLVRPMLRENGGWAAFITTPRGKNHAWKLYQMATRNPDWFAETRTLWDTRAYDPEATIAEERASGMPESLIQQEYFCDWNAAVVGAIFGDLVETLEAEGAIQRFDLATPDTITTWDLGRTDATAIWFWQVNRETGGLDVVDHYEAHGKPLSHYFGVLKEKTERMGYAYRQHWLPHDARARTLAAGSSIQDQCMDALGHGRVAIVPNLDRLDGSQAARKVLQHPATRFHERCRDGVEALKAYRYEYDEDSKAFGRNPVHDWSSHTSDAFRYLGVVAKVASLLSERESRGARVRRAVTAPDATLDQLWEAADSEGPRNERI